jgi:hypothetical protein
MPEFSHSHLVDPPGWYPTATVNGTPVFSTFAQRYTGTLTNGQVCTIGDLTTPVAPYSTPVIKLHHDLHFQRHQSSKLGCHYLFW